MSKSKKTLLKEWKEVIDHSDLPEVKNPTHRKVMAQLLENAQIETDKQMRSDASYRSLVEAHVDSLEEAAPANNFGDGNIKYVDPVIIPMIRRLVPNLIGFDMLGVQPMTGPTGLVFARRARYTNQGGSEALYQEADTDFSATPLGANITNGTFVQQTGTSVVGANSTNFTAGSGMATSYAESLGDGTLSIPEMAFTIEKLTVTANTRALAGGYTVELMQDLKAVHGLDAESELSEILAQELTAEINREVVRKILISSTIGAQHGVANAGVFDLDVDSNGRWSVEKWKGLLFQIDREANAIAKDTRFGRGNIIITTADVASALRLTGMLDYAPALRTDGLMVDDTGGTFVGVLNGQYKVYIDPYFVPNAAGDQFLTVAFKGNNEMTAGMFYCPYVPLQMYRAVDPKSFQPRIGFKTRYGLVANPFATDDADGVVSFAKKNKFYRTITIKNLI